MAHRRHPAVPALDAARPGQRCRRTSGHRLSVVAARPRVRRRRYREQSSCRVRRRHGLGPGGHWEAPPWPRTAQSADRGPRPRSAGLDDLAHGKQCRQDLLADQLGPLRRDGTIIVYVAIGAWLVVSNAGFAQHFARLITRALGALLLIGAFVQCLPGREFWHGENANALTAMTSFMIMTPSPTGGRDWPGTVAWSRAPWAPDSISSSYSGCSPLPRASGGRRMVIFIGRCGRSSRVAC